MERAVEQPATAASSPARSGAAPSVEEAWDMVTSQIRPEMNQGSFDAYITTLKLLGYQEGVFRLGAANRLALEWVQGRYSKRIAGLLDTVYNRPVTLAFSVLNGAYHAPEAVTEQQGGGEVAAPEAAERKKTQRPKGETVEAESAGGSPRKLQLQRAYGTERARVVQPERGLFVTLYLMNQWLPLVGQSALTTILAARSLCYWNPMTGELRNTVETDMAELARRAAVSVRTVKDVLNNHYIRDFFLRYKVRRVMTPNGVRTAGIVLQVRMDDPLTPEDQIQHSLPEDDHWYTVEFADEVD